MTDNVFAAFLEGQFHAADRLARQSDILELIPLGETPIISRYVAEFHCASLGFNKGSREVESIEHTQVGIWFPPNYLQVFEIAAVVSWLGPVNIWHPNIRPPYMCLGPMAPGTVIEDILFQVYEIISFQRIGMAEPLNSDACDWARQNQARFPVDNRPLKRRSADLDIEKMAIEWKVEETHP